MRTATRYLSAEEEVASRERLLQEAEREAHERAIDVLDTLHAELLAQRDRDEGNERLGRRKRLLLKPRLLSLLRTMAVADYAHEAVEAVKLVGEENYVRLLAEEMGTKL